MNAYPSCDLCSGSAYAEDPETTELVPCPDCRPSPHTTPRSKIVAELRAAAGRDGYHGSIPALAIAADWLEANTPVMERTEVERLREALRKIAENEPHESGGGPWPEQIARDALSRGERST